MKRKVADLIKRKKEGRDLKTDELQALIVKFGGRLRGMMNLKQLIPFSVILTGCLSFLSK